MLVGSKTAGELVHHVAIHLYKEDNESTNIDYHLALSILVKSGGGERLIRRIQSENIRSYFRSLLSLTERNNDTYISHVKTIFDVVGYRNGARHHTLLYRQLDAQKKTTAEITTTILALFDQVLIGLSSLKKFTSGLPNTCNYNWLKEKIESIESLIEIGRAHV